MGCCMPATSFNSSISGYWPGRARSISIVSGQLMVPPAAPGKKVDIVYSIVIVHVQRANPVPHAVEFVLDARAHVGVAGIEHEVHVEVCEVVEVLQTGCGGEVVGNVLQQNFNAALAAEKAEFVEGVVGGLEGFFAELLISLSPRCWIRVTERSDLPRCPARA